jgi:hypothetical protein
MQRVLKTMKCMYHFLHLDLELWEDNEILIIRWKRVILENVADVDFRQKTVILDILRSPLELSFIFLGRSLLCADIWWSSRARAFFVVMLWDEFEVDLRRRRIFDTTLKLMNGEDIQNGKWSRIYFLVSFL